MAAAAAARVAKMATTTVRPRTRTRGGPPLRTRPDVSAVATVDS